MSQEGETTAAMANMEIAADDVEDSAKKGFFKRDALRANETAVQKKWADAKVFESNPESDKESFMVTFPYPYSNGHLHIGHAFSLTKAVFRAQYERHQGKNVLFPFAFHCTGMPIQAVRIL
jgi:leucyl-tRNA synthetase